MDYDILPDAETPNVGPINFNTDDPVTSLRYIDGEWKTSSEVVISELTNYSNFSKPMQFEEIDETPPMPEDYPVIKGLLYKKAGSDGLWWLTDTIEKNVAGDATISVSDTNGNLTFDDAKGVLSLTANPTFGTVIVDNNLYVSGTTTTVNTTNLLVSDAFIKIADGNILPGTDVGFYTTFRTDPDDVLTTKYAGLYRDGTESAWYLFDHVSTPDPGPGQGFNPAITDVSNYGTLYLNTLNATSVKVSGLTASTLVVTDGSKNLTSLAVGDNTQYLRGDNTYQTLNQAAVSGLTTGSSPTFTGLNLSGLTANSLVATDGSKNLTTTTSTMVPRFQRLGIGVDNLPRSALTVSGTISGGVNTHQYGIECSVAMDITTTGYSAYFHLIGNLGSVNVPAEGTSGGIYGIYVDGDNISRTGGTPANSWGIRSISPNVISTNAVGIGTDSLVVSGSGNPWTSRTLASGQAYISGCVGIGTTPVLNTILRVAGTVNGGVNAHQYGIICNPSMTITTANYGAYYHFINGSVAVPAGGSNGIWGLYVDGNGMSKTGGTPVNSWGIQSISPNVSATNAVGIGTDSLVVSTTGNPWTSRTTAAGRAFISGGLGIGMNPGSSSIRINDLTSSALVATDSNKQLTSTTNNLTPIFSRLALGGMYGEVFTADQSMFILKGTIEQDSPNGILINPTLNMVNEGGGKIGRGIFLNALLKGSGMQDNVAQLWIKHRTESARNDSAFSFSYGIHVDVPAAHAGVGNLPLRQYGIYSRTPTQGTISNCAIYGDNLSIGYMAVTPPASGAIILGNVGIGRNSASFALDVSGTVRASTGVIAQSTVLNTNATSGFLYIPTCAGVPTGVPAVQTGTVAMVYDTSSDKLMVYNGAWRGVTMT